jgi:SPRY domain-containing SOCS box protein 1/4
VKNKCYHKGEEHTYPNWLATREVFQIPDDFMVVLDMDDGTLGFIVDNVYLGVAFTGLKGKKLYPIISTVWGNGEVGIKYVSGLEPGPQLLQECCRKVIRNSVGKQWLKCVRSDLHLPNILKDYLLN